MRPQIKFALALGLVAFIGYLLRGPAPLQLTESTLAGTTMGTPYSIKLVSPNKLTKGDMDAITKSVEKRLAEVNQSMSTYIEDSEICQFNLAPNSKLVKISQDFADVVRSALNVSMESQGAFDPTVMPLVDAWGFGPIKREGEPSEEEISRARAQIGFHKLLLNMTRLELSKSEPSLRLDLSAIAKGYGVDEICEVLKSHDLENYMVEIGGEIRTQGINSRGIAWKIGVVNPSTAPNQPLSQIVLNVADRAIATSGDYRNYREVDGKRISHCIDPRTGRPIEHKLASVSVIAPTCMRADALATAIFVLGVKDGLELVNGLPDAEAYLLERKGDTFVTHQSKAFGAYIAKPAN